MKVLRSFLLFSIFLLFTTSFFLIPDDTGSDEKVFEADKGPDKIDVKKYPKEMQSNYKIFYKRCSKCHTIARPINTDFTIEKWKRYVKRMMRKPGSGITSKTGKKIFLFLEYYTEHKEKKKKKK